MDKLDFKKTLGKFYKPSADVVEELDLPAFHYAVVPGKGSPNGPGFQEAVQALYSTSYTLKFGRKKAGLRPDYSIPPLEALWWMPGSHDFSPETMDQWEWEAMLMQPDFITQAEFTEAVEKLQKEKDLPGLRHITLHESPAGRCVQIMHIGPYGEEKTTVDKLLDYAKQHGLTLVGKHREIYLNDPRRTKPEKLHTIIRYAVETA